MAFFRNEPITDVVRRLKLRADGEAGINLLTRSVVTQRASAWGRPGGMTLQPSYTDMGRGTLPEG